MLGLLVVLFLVVPIVELYVIVQVTHTVGVPETILLLIGISVVGAWLAKAAGISVLNRIQGTIRAGRVPSGELIDGGLVLFAGALMLTPGFLSDGLALLLLLPPTRAMARQVILRKIRAGGGMVNIVVGDRFGRARMSDAGMSGSGGSDEVWDTEGWEDPPTPPGRRGLSQ